MRKIQQCQPASNELGSQALIMQPAAEQHSKLGLQSDRQTGRGYIPDMLHTLDDLDDSQLRFQML